MKTKREVLEEIIDNELCRSINCANCPYNKESICDGNDFLIYRLAQIGAMAILRMFRKKKKPLLKNRTKIRFSDGRIATIVKIEPKIDSIACYYQLEFGDYHKDMDYLVGRTWEVVE